MPSGSTRATGARPITVLIVNDKVEEALHYAAAMLQHGWRVDVASHPSALLYIGTRRPDVIVIDEGGRPPHEAFALAQRLRAESGIPVVVLATLRVPAIADRAHTLGCVCVRKPCRAASLIASVRSAVAISPLPMVPRTAKRGRRRHIGAEKRGEPRRLARASGSPSCWWRTVIARKKTTARRILAKGWSLREAGLPQPTTSSRASARSLLMW